MKFLGRDVAKRSDTTVYHTGAVSVVMVSLNYFPDTGMTLSEGPVIARYALGKDYHQVMKEKLAAMMASLKETVPGIEGRPFADTSPVMEKALAVRAGLGNQGKNTLLITGRGGSFYFLGGLIINREAEYDQPAVGDPCGNCSRCIDACPTAALSEEGFLDAGRCISYLTVEHRGEFPEGVPAGFSGRVFGCDICQEVCPHNAGHKPHKVPEFLPSPGLLSMAPDDWSRLAPGGFDTLFRGSAVHRCGYSGFMRNLSRAKG